VKFQESVFYKRALLAIWCLGCMVFSLFTAARSKKCRRLRVKEDFDIIAALKGPAAESGV